MKIEYKGKEIDPFAEYARIKEEIAILDKQRSELEPIVQNLMDNDGIKEKLTSYGYFVSMGRKSWKYSEEVEKIAERLKEKKHQEEISGVASVKKITSYIMFDKKRKS